MEVNIQGRRSLSNAFNYNWATGDIFSITEEGRSSGLCTHMPLHNEFYFITVIGESDFFNSNYSYTVSKRLKLNISVNSETDLRKYFCVFALGSRHVFEMDNYPDSWWKKGTLLFDKDVLSTKNVVLYLSRLIDERFFTWKKEYDYGFYSHTKRFLYLNSNSPPTNEILCIKDDLPFKRMNLKGKELKIVCDIERGYKNSEYVLVEFKDYIGGGNGDGLGKEGHCIIVNRNIIMAKNIGT